MRLVCAVALVAAGCTDDAPTVGADVAVDAGLLDAVADGAPDVAEDLVDAAAEDLGGGDDDAGVDAPPPDVADAADADDTAPDAGDAADAGDADIPPEPSRCEVGALTITCDRDSTTLFTGLTGFYPREVHHQVPLGEPPPEGWPAVILFQGSLFTAELFWIVVDVPIGGAWNQGMLTKTLLDSGFAVITPEALGAGTTAWQTNVPPASLAWSTATDHYLMLDLFDAIDAGDFGEIDGSRLYAGGISSGGYMTSRMDLEYRERFRALAIHSASYATCAGPVCVVPSDLEAEHLPTLFLHGALDLVVPVGTMELYRDALADLGVEVDTVIDAAADHAWIDAAPTAIRDWFATH